MNNIESNKGEIVMYQPDETIRLEVRMDEETVWLTQQQMAELFQKDQSVVARHINNAFKEGELDENSNMHFLHNTRYKYRPTKVYSLDVIISVGYRVKSKRGTAFRQWANKVLKDYLLRGYAINKRIAQIEQRTDTRFESHAARISALEDKVDFFVRSSLPRFFRPLIPTPSGRHLLRRADLRCLRTDHQPHQTGETLHHPYRQLYQC